MSKYNIKKQNGKYLNYFDTQEEASNHIAELIRTYRYHPHPDRISIPSMLKEQEEKYGIKINQASFYRWVEDAHVTRRNNWAKEKRIYRSYTLDPEVDRELKAFPNKSRMVELGIRIILGLPSKDIVLFLEDGIRIIFTEEGKRIKAVTTARLNERDKKLIRSWVEGANIHGKEYIIKQCKAIGFDYYGGDI